MCCTDERESVQKKTFTKWVNSHLMRINCSIEDLYVDLRDGRMLIKLLEVLSGERLVSDNVSSVIPVILPLDEAIASKTVFVIVSRSDKWADRIENE